MNLLSQRELCKQGLPEIWIMGVMDYVRYSELDTYNHVNNKVYLSWFENLRVEYLSKTDINFFQKAPIMPVVRSASIEYHKPLFLSDHYTAVIRCIRIGNSSFDLEYGVYCKGVHCISGATTMVMADLEAGISVPLSPKIREIFLKRDRAQE